MKYFGGVIREFRNIRWLSISRAFVLTLVVIFFGVSAGLLLGILDNSFSSVVREIVI